MNMNMKGKEDYIIYKMIYEYKIGRMTHEESIVHENLIWYEELIKHENLIWYIFSQFNYAMIKGENTY